MRAVVQRVSEASVSVAGKVSGAISMGFLLYLGIANDDESSDAEYLADKIIGLRVFNDQDEKMNLSIKEIGGSILVVSQFTLLADARKGRRPSYSNAAQAESAVGLYQHFVSLLKKEGISTETGVFQATMQVLSINEGPVTILLDSKKHF